jgi:hypothetical protein
LPLREIGVSNQLIACDVPIHFIAAAGDGVVPAGNLRQIQQLKAGHTRSVSFASKSC